MGKTRLGGNLIGSTSNVLPHSESRDPSTVARSSLQASATPMQTPEILGIREGGRTDKTLSLQPSVWDNANPVDPVR